MHGCSRRGSLPPGAASGRQVAPDLWFLAALRGPGGLEGAEVTSGGQRWQLARSPPPPPRRARDTRAGRGHESGGASLSPELGHRCHLLHQASARPPRLSAPRRRPPWRRRHKVGGRLSPPPRSGPEMHREDSLPALANFTPGPTGTAYACGTPRLRAPSGSRLHP